MLGTTRESWWHVVLLTARHYWSTWPCELNLNLLTSCCSMWSLRCKEPKIRSWVRQWISWITCLATCAVNSVNSSHAGETLSWVVLSNFSNFHFKFWKFDYRGNMGWRVFFYALMPHFCHSVQVLELRNSLGLFLMDLMVEESHLQTIGLCSPQVICWRFSGQIADSIVQETSRIQVDFKYIDMIDRYIYIYKMYIYIYKLYIYVY